MRSLKHQGITWHDDPERSQTALNKIQKLYDFHDLDIEDCLSEHERPKVEEYPHYLFLVFHIPYLSPRTKRILKEEINIFVGADFIITLHDGKIAVLDDLWKALKKSEPKRNEYFESGTGFFLYELMREFFFGVFPLVDSITKNIRKTEGKLFDSDDEVNMLKDIMTLKRNIITMRSIISPQRTLIATLEHKNKKFVSAELALYFDDILDAIERQWSLLDTAKEMIDALQNTHETWLAHKTNSVVKVLTTFSVIMLPLTLLTSFYGMNVRLPLDHNAAAAWYIMGVMGIICVAMIGYFLKKRWL